MSYKEKAKQYLEELRNAKRPVILVGGGVRIGNAVEEMREVGRVLGVPCIPTYNALDVITDDYEFDAGKVGTFGGKGRNYTLQNSDLLLGVGTRLSGRITGSGLKAFAREARRYVVDVDPALLQPRLQQVPFHVNILAGAKPFLETILELTDGKPVADFSNWNKRVQGWKKKYDPVRPEYLEPAQFANPYAFFRVLSQEMSNTDILIGDCGGNLILSNHAFETKYGQRNITNNGNSPMGFSFAAGIGAWLATNGERNVVCTIGDGGMQMNMQELQTIKDENMGFKTFIINNHIYGITAAFQEIHFQGRREACGPKGYSSPDFKKIVSAYDISVASIESNDIPEMRRTIRQVLDHKGPIVCDVNCHDWNTYEPRIFGGAPLEDMFPFLPREEHLSNMIIAPSPGYENVAAKLPPNLKARQAVMEERFRKEFAKNAI